MPPVETKGPAKKGKSKKATEERVLMYPDYKEVRCVGDKALTVERGKELLKWITEDEWIAHKTEGMSEKVAEKEAAKHHFGDDYLLTDEDGKKVRCLNNTSNRPFHEHWSKTIAQDILRGNWKYNGQSVGIGRYGQITDGQHRLIALVLAEQMRSGKNKEMYAEQWPNPVTIETLVVFGIDEDAKTTRTIDNTRARTLADVLFCDPRMFGDKYSASERVKLARSTQFCIARLCERTRAYKGGVGTNGVQYATHSESLDFLERHPRVIEAVKEVYKLNIPPAQVARGTSTHNTKPQGATGKLSAPSAPLTKYTLSSLGDCAAFLYLMGSSATNPDDGYLSERREVQGKEKVVDWGNWDKAVSYWTALSKKLDQVSPVIKAIHGLRDPDSDVQGGTYERIAILLLGWEVWLAGEEIKDSDLILDKPTTPAGDIHLVTWPTAEGIDLGSPRGDVELKWYSEYRAAMKNGGNKHTTTQTALTPPQDDNDDEEEEVEEEPEEEVEK